MFAHCPHSRHKSITSNFATAIKTLKNKKGNTAATVLQNRWLNFTNSQKDSEKLIFAVTAS